MVLLENRKGGRDFPTHLREKEPQKRSDGELGLETVSWDALVYPSCFSVWFFNTGSSAPGQNSVKARERCTGCQSVLRSREAATQLSTISHRDHRHLSGHWFLPRKPFSTEALTIMFTELYYITKEMALESFQWWRSATSPSSHRPESNRATSRGKRGQEAERRCIMLLFLCLQHQSSCLTHFILEMALEMKAERAKRHPEDTSVLAVKRQALSPPDL